jgi:hypothetical protein
MNILCSDWELSSVGAKKEQLSEESEHLYNNTEKCTFAKYYKSGVLKIITRKYVITHYFSLWCKCPKITHKIKLFLN